MSVVDLKTRSTEDQDAYRRSLRSDDSLILISPLPEQVETASIDFNIGTNIFDSEKGEKRSLPSEGFTLRPRRSVVVYTEQRVSLPNNVFGMLSGKGRLIYHGVFISQGKIDPGFQDYLRVGLYNGSRKPVHLKLGEKICSCTFFQMETHVQDILTEDSDEPIKMLRPTISQYFASFCRSNWKWIIGTLIAAAVLVTRILGLWEK